MNFAWTVHLFTIHIDHVSYAPFHDFIVYVACRSVARIVSKIRKLNTINSTIRWFDASTKQGDVTQLFLNVIILLLFLCVFIIHM